jgi:4-carboxymuconolactone decarboxylase
VQCGFCCPVHRRIAAVTQEQFRVKFHQAPHGRNLTRLKLMSIVPKQPFGFSGHDDERAKAAGKYVHEKNSSYYLELGPGGDFVLFQDSEITGTYEINGSTVTLFVARRPISTAKLEDGGIIDDQGDRWVRSTVPPITRQHERQDEAASAAEKLPGDFAPKLVQLTEDVLFADVWERAELSKRDRSLITVAALVALNRPEQLRFHLGRAVENGVRAEELIEAITHLAFYSGWPNAMTAMNIAKELFSKGG